MYRSVQFPDISYYYVVKWIGTFWYKKLKKKLSIKVEKKSDAVCADWLESSTLLFLVAFTFLDQYFGRWYHTHTYTRWFFLWKKKKKKKKQKAFRLFSSSLEGLLRLLLSCVVLKIQKKYPPFSSAVLWTD